jgi:type IV secretory pathway VirB4 component
MAQYKENDITYAAHISLYGIKDERDCRRAWNEFIQKTEITDVILFYPKTKALQKLQSKRWKPDRTIDICGYIIENKCYSAVIDIAEKKVIKEIEHIPLIGKENCYIRESHGETGKIPSSCVIL